MAAPSQNRAMNVQAKGPETTGICTRRGVVEWRRYKEVRLKKLMPSINSAIQNRDRTHNRIKADCSRLLMMKWLPTLAADLTHSALFEKRCQT